MIKEGEPEIKNEGKEPIVDIELNEATLEEWKEKELDKDICSSIEKFNKSGLPNGVFLFDSFNFEASRDFVDDAREEFEKRGLSGAKNFEEKIEEVKGETKKAILTFAFKELEIDPKNPVLLREEKREENGKKLKIKHYANAYPGLVLATDSIDWWLERK